MFETTSLDQPLSAPNKNMHKTGTVSFLFSPKKLLPVLVGGSNRLFLPRCRGSGGGIIIDSSEIQRLEPENQPLDKEKISEPNLHFQVSEC